MSRPQLELIWRAPGDAIKRKTMPWHRGCSFESLSEYMSDYLAMISEGYRPKDYDYVPIPHCARIQDRGRVLAEWDLRPGSGAESLVMAQVPQAGEASPQQQPSPAITTSLIDAASRPQRANNGRRSAAKATQVESGSGIPAA